MTNVFISYSRQDLAAVRRVHDALQAAGVSVWRDEKWLAPGDEWAAEITKAIRASLAVVLLISPSSNESRWVRREVCLADTFKKRILPFWVKDAGTLSDSLSLFLADTHISEFTADRDLPQLVATVRTYIGSAGIAGTTIAGKQTPDALFTSGDQFVAFLRDTNRTVPGGISRGSGAVRNVTWNLAIEYCDWHGGCLPPWQSNDIEGQISAPGTLSGLCEWLDAGDEDFKQVRSCDDAALVALMLKEHGQDNVTFRCGTVAEPEDRRMIDVPGASVVLGTNIKELRELESRFRLSPTVLRHMFRRAEQTTEIAPFSIATTCVTNQEFYAFARKTGSRFPAHWDTKWLARFDQPFPPRLASCPVVNVDAVWAQKYCVWSKTRLPMWDEWEYAARGPERRSYPWANAYDRQACNSVESGRGTLAAVHECALGDSPFAVRQMSGNVAEWVRGPDGQPELRGGSFRDACELWGLTYAFRTGGVRQLDAVGFRVVRGGQ